MSDLEFHSHPPTPEMSAAYRQLLADIEDPSFAEQDRNWLADVVALFNEPVPA